MINAEIWLADWFQHREPLITLSPEANYFVAGAIDSFGVIELIEEIEQTFSVKFTQEEFQDPRFVSIQGLAELIEGLKIQ
jgi:D-alanine--poly(phosphoribitol) ligase subunit 2